MIGSKQEMIISEIREIYDSLHIPQRHTPYIFMCPKEREGDVEFIMYIYGGAAFKFYYDKGIQVDIPSDEYKKHFRDEKRGEEVLGKLKNREDNESRIKLMKYWPESVWGEVCEAFYFWALKVKVPSEGRKNPEFERMRETHICCINSNNSDIRVFDMEEKMKMPDDSGEPEADMLSIRHDKEGRPVLSVIEYKCTTSALKGSKNDSGKKASLMQHYRDMKGYYREKDAIAKMLKLYEWKQMFDGNDVEEISLDDVVSRTEMIFLFSNIQWGRNESNIGLPGMNESTTVTNENIYNKLIELQQEKDFEDTGSKIKVILLNDADTDDVVLLSENLLSYEEALEKLK